MTRPPRAVADDISTAHLFNVDAQRATAQVYTRQGHFDQAVALLEAYLVRRPGNLSITLGMAELAHEADNSQIMQEYSARLGAGIPAGISSQDLKSFQTLQAHFGRTESATAATLELQRRRQMDRQAMLDALSPFTSLDTDALADLGQIYRSLSGPEASPSAAKRARAVKLAAIRNFGFGSLRAGQTETSPRCLRGESVLAVMPTGAGKSLCYQLPGLELAHATLVISPLIALMKDQVEGLPAIAQAKATFINSSLDDDELKRRMDRVAAGQLQTGLRRARTAAPAPLSARPARCGSEPLCGGRGPLCQPVGPRLPPGLSLYSGGAHGTGQPARPGNDRHRAAPGAGRNSGHPQPQRGSSARPAEPDRAAPGGGPGHLPHNLHLSAIQFHNDEEKLAALLKFVTETDGSGIVYANIPPQDARPWPYVCAAKGWPPKPITPVSATGAVCRIAL